MAVDSTSFPRASFTGCTRRRQAEKDRFAGVGKTDEEIRAGLRGRRLDVQRGERGRARGGRPRGCFRRQGRSDCAGVNPDVDPKTHRYISTGKKESKFGMDIVRAERAAETAATISSIRMIGMHMHIGSQITTTEPYAGAVAKGVELIGRLRGMGHPIDWYNMGGGYGIDYKAREARQVDEFARVIVPGVKSTGCRLASNRTSDRRERGHPGQPCGIYQGVGGEAVPDPGCRDE